MYIYIYIYIYTYINIYYEISKSDNINQNFTNSAYNCILPNASKSSKNTLEYSQND